MLIKPGHLLPVAREGAGVSLSTRRCFLHDQRKHREVVLLNNRSLWQLKGAGSGSQSQGFLPPGLGSGGGRSERGAPGDTVTAARARRGLFLLYVKRALCFRNTVTHKRDIAASS